MSNKPAVSVIIIFLNEERFLQEAIESVLAQSYCDWELLLVDDGSIDESTEIGLGYAEKHPEKVRYLEHDGHKNRGMSASRNLGIRYAKGEYITFLDADDVWLPNKLEQQVAILDSQPEAGMLFGHTLHWYSWMEDAEPAQRDFILPLRVQHNTVIEPPTLLYFFLGNEKQYPCICSVLVRRETIQQVGGFEDHFTGLYEDRAFHAKVFLKSPVFVSSECWDMYRQDPDNSYVIAQQKGEYHPLNPNPLELAFWKWFEGYLISQGIKDPKIWKIVRRKLWRYHYPVFYRVSKVLKYPIEQFKILLRLMARWILPAPLHCWLKARWLGMKR